ncbi:unnamed protein product [Candidula unifasciata]|uniref:Lariat debranching enzyme C-terminal domain-containing protein n=1 Tax=Candidula unifasciata TaxID=100452 RepID=A0A8S3Z2S1_9EUPU|nr:unnamed protein product [Candidula unifasciata]
MKIAVEGCCHGELDKIYDSVSELERQNGFKIDLLIICGDFQAVRNFDDLQAMAVPPKFQKLNTFYKYYSGEKLAPVLTVFIGGNHEASNYMQELPYGGWVAPNIYYMGYGGIIQIGNVRIGGVSGIFKGHDYNRGHFERPPYDDHTKRSVYHVRNLEIFRLKQITRPVDIFISHDWPRGIYHYGDTASLIKRKPFFRQEIEENKLGSGPLFDLLCHIQPTYWFAAHLHVKFAAHVQHQSASEQAPGKSTKFLSLDKCLPRRSFLQVLDVPHGKEPLKIKLDPEWLGILKKTDHLLNITSSNRYMPGPGCGERYEFTVDDSEIKKMVDTFGGDLTLPNNFVHTSPPLEGNPDAASRQRRQDLVIRVNPQTTLLCSMLGITDPNMKFLSCQELVDNSSRASDSDAVYESSDGEDMPSTVDSSIDVSSSRLSSSQDTCKTANETLDSSCQQLLRLQQNIVTSTPAKNGPVKRSFEEDVDDNDAELLSILSAQRNKSLNSSSHIPSVSPSADSSSPCVHSVNVSHGAIHCDNRVTSTSSDCCDSQLSPSHVPSSQDKAALKPERTSFGMSGLCLNVTEVSHLSSEDSAVITPESGKKLKRRNVSLYSEQSE